MSKQEKRITQDDVLNNFSIFIHQLNQLKPDLVSQYSLPAQFENETGMCFGFTMAHIAISTSPDPEQSPQQQLINEIGQLNKFEITQFISEGTLDKLEPFSIEDVIMLFKKIDTLHNMERYGHHQWLFSKAISYRHVSFRSNNEYSLSVGERLEKLLPQTNGLWFIDFRKGENNGHAVAIWRESKGEDKQSKYYCYDCNQDITKRCGPFDRLSDVADFLSKHYHLLNERMFYVNRLVPPNDFDKMVNQIFNLFKNKNSFVDKYIDEYKNDQISQIQFALLIVTQKKLVIPAKFLSFFTDFICANLLVSEIGYEFFVAAKKNQIEIVDFFLEEKGSYDFSSLDKVTALDLAIKCRNLGTIEVILNRLTEAALQNKSWFYNESSKGITKRLAIPCLQLLIEIAETAAINNQTDILVLFKPWVFEAVLKKTRLPQEQDNIQANIKRVVLHKINNLYPLNSEAKREFKLVFPFSSRKIPSAAQVIEKITPEQLADFGKLLKMTDKEFKHSAPKPPPPTFSRTEARAHVSDIKPKSPQPPFSMVKTKTQGLVSTGIVKPPPPSIPRSKEGLNQSSFLKQTNVQLAPTELSNPKVSPSRDFS